MIYFTADLHLGDTRLVEATRPECKDVVDHDNDILGLINNHVGRGDRLIILGDFCYEKPGRYRPQIRCRNIDFILGNHDSESKIRKSFGGNVWQQRMIKLAPGVKVWCSHYPTAFWDGSHNGKYHAYGHIHNCPEREAMMDLGMPERRSMDVGVESAKKLLGDWRPFSAVEFLSLTAHRPGHDIIRRDS